MHFSALIFFIKVSFLCTFGISQFYIEIKTNWESLMLFLLSAFSHLFQLVLMYEH